MKSQQYIAHIRESDGAEQSLVDHLKEVQVIAENIGEKIGIPHVTGLAGMLHDMGKFSDEFQNYLREAYANQLNPPKRGSVNHSTAGGKFLMERYHSAFNKISKIYPALIECISNVIFSHHGQLLDMINPEGNSPFIDRMTPTKPIEINSVAERFFHEVCDETYLLEYIKQANNEFIQFIDRTLQKVSSKTEGKALLRKTLALLTKFVFSALIDADRRNSREFEEEVKKSEEIPIEINALFEQFEMELEEQLREKQVRAIPNEITRLRQQMSDHCFTKAALPTGIYTLSIPTGGGKTLASLRFALRHAQLHSKKRIIYIVPFTTIIEQNAEEVRQILRAEDYILEHHSNVILNEVEYDDFDNVSFEKYQQIKKMKIAKDDWDIPIIFTTMVQFLDTFYNGASRNTRRLHNLANTIIIFDEVQTVPIQCISLFNEALNFLKKGCQTTILLCTATQPALQYVKRNIQINGELVENLPEIVKAFKRTEIVPLLKNAGWHTEDLARFVADKLYECGNVLVILNTKKVVKALYDKLVNCNAEIYHLSTAMCPAHRKVIIQEIRQKLKQGEPIICISTQLIEAGVDVSFNSVIRSLAGLDSIAQAAGRCNRNGEVSLREVYVINHAEEKLEKLPTIKQGGECSKYIVSDIEKDPNLFEGNFLSNASLEHYFKMYFTAFETRLDYPIYDLNTSIYDILLGANSQFKSENNNRQPLGMVASFKTAASYFEVIEANTYPILVPYGGGKELINILTGKEMISNFKRFFRKAQQYSVNVFRHEFNKLDRNKLIREVDFGFCKIYVAKENAYSLENGLNIDGEAKLEEYHF
ncbi:CRISPR-associated helicase Cas3' [Psychrobacillus sp. FSL H8-0484]|uniref:CRISPR-associated helicase Cas3' n=1 Tax=Psychrobacillus sp. FSL H8-0484 TaxID=2921390 RepID=UPI0030FC42F6